ncbi:MAG: glutamyl-tRNA reductase [Caldilineaceae bacterium]|nr:glutamyl-tRNA reductase [Caldilineaceae bacterium]
MAPTLRSGLRVASIALSRVTAPVEVREQLGLQNWAALLSTGTSSVREWAIISTCHRFELYVGTESDALELVCAQLPVLLSSVVNTTTGHIFAEGSEPWAVRTDEDAVIHLCRVAAGLDSLVLGEAQIQGQVIASYTMGLDEGTIGPLLSALFRTAIRVGKRARTETQISTRALSMSSVALSMAARYFPDFAAARVLVIGAGEMSRLALKALHQRHVRNVTVANRTLARAREVLLHPEWQAIDLAKLPKALSTFDVIFSATSAHEPVVTHSHLADALPTNGADHQRVLIDLAVPRDIDPSIRNLPGVVLVDVDDLRQGLDQSLEKRKEALPAVNAIIDQEVARWQAVQRELSMRPLVVELRQRAERIRQQEVERTMRFLGPVDSETQDHIQHLSRALVNKLLHQPTVRIKELAHDDEADLYASTLCDIFGLDAGLSVVPQSESENAELRGKSNGS